jgi:ATP-binding cassette, subfamily B, bacterial PglK
MLRMNEVQVVRDLLAILPPTQRAKLLLLAGGLFFVGMIEMVGLSVVFVYISVLDKMSTGNIGGSEAIATLIAWTGIRDAASASIWFGLALIATFIVKSGTIISIYAVVMRFVFDNFRMVGERLFQGYLNAPYEYHLVRSSFDLQRTINVELPAAFTSASLALVYLISNIFTISLMAVALIAVQPYVTLFAVVVLGGSSTIFYSLFRQFTYRLGVRRHKNVEGSIKWVSQALDGIREIRVFGRERFFAESFRHNITGVTDSERRLRTFYQVPSLVNEAILVCGVVGIIVGSIASGQPLPTLLPTLAMFGVAGVRISGMVSSMVNQLQMLQYTSQAVNTIRRELDDVAEIEPAADVADEPMTGDITFDRVSYVYPAAKTATVDGLSCRIVQGSRVAFVGPSGAGKSTIIALLLGLLRPTSGALRVGTREIADTFVTWRKGLSFVPQTIFLLDDTVRGNVLFGLGRDNVSDAEIWDALEVAQLADFVRSQPNGLDTPVGENGLSLSGGERQRLGIARALFRKPRVLILDEATASLDGITEQKLTKAILDRRSDMTLIVVAHRLSTIRDCDLIYYMEGGRILDSGQYDALLQSCPGFRALAQIGQTETRIPA